MTEPSDGHQQMFADKPDQDVAREEGPDEPEDHQAGAIDDSTEPDRPFPPPAQPPKEARQNDRAERDHRVGARLHHPAPGGTKEAARQVEAEQHLPEQRHPSLQEGACLLAVLGGQWWFLTRHG